ncbi:MAG TPA: proline racemase family protein, partial [Thermoplasmata archaeon]|nr:proline racemase family protein [Thermoplasmata archaeon]
RPGQLWKQEGILGGVFEAIIEPRGSAVVPTITGHAYVTAEAELVLDEQDPFRNGFPS